MIRRKSPPETIAFCVATSLGRIGIAFSGKGLVSIDLGHRGSKQRWRSGGTIPSFARRAVELVMRYAAGEDVAFNVPLDLGKATAFQRAVWRAAVSIPYGETRSYAWIAKRIKRSGAARAVGQALGANPVPIIVPCHRVVSSSGGLGGFSGGGPAMKRRLLNMESGSSVLAVEAERKRGRR